MEMNTAAWDALQDFMQRNEYLIDREYVSACRHFADSYDRDAAFDIWQSALNRYLPYIQEIDRMTGRMEERLGITTALTDACIRASLTHLAERIPVYAMMRTGKRQAVQALLAFLSAGQETVLSESV